MRLYEFSFGVSLVVLFCLFETGQSLECFSCNATTTAKDDNPCKDIAKKVLCTEPAICLSAKYSTEDPTTKLKQYTTQKSCHIKNGQECSTFEKNAKQGVSPNFKVEMVDKCYTCLTVGCNEKSEPSSSAVLLPTVVVTAICYLIARLM